jgi:hypothetical protein
LAFEYQGEQHYVFPNHCHKTIEMFNKQVERDLWKKEQCDKNNVKLVIINQFNANEYDNIKDKVTSLLKKDNII